MSAPEFTVTLDKLNDGIVKVSVTGFLDAHTFEQMEQQIEGLFNEGTHKIIVDMSKVEYISSAGCGVFIGAISDAKDNDGDIVLLGTTTNVMEVFELLGLNQIFHFSDTLEDAQAVFAA